jgi:tetratricopeptide (TPR) repeat protein
MVTNKTASALLISLLLLAWCTSASAQRPASQPANEDLVKKVEAYYAEGAAMFKAGAYNKALERFKAAYGLIPVSNLLYNMGRCYEALGNIDEALSHYKRCMDDSESSEEAKVRSAQRYEVLVKAKVSGAKAAKPARGEDTAPVEPTPSSGGLLTLLRWSTLGLGVALGVAGAVTFASGAGDHGEIEDLEGFGNPDALLDMTRSRALELNDSGKTKKTIGVVLLGAAGAALVTSAVLFFVSSGERKPEVALTVAPDPRSGAHLLLTGSF